MTTISDQASTVDESAQSATNAAAHILEDRRGSFYYKDIDQLAAYIEGALNIRKSVALRFANSIEEDRKGANFYSDRGILAEFLASAINVGGKIRKSGQVAPFELESEFYTDEGCHIVEIYNSENDENCSIARARVEPGVTTRLHRVFGTVERYVILSGEGLVEINGGEPVRVKHLDVAQIPINGSQKITNIGEESLTFLAICTPRFKQKNYEDIENLGELTS